MGSISEKKNCFRGGVGGQYIRKKKNWKTKEDHYRFLGNCPPTPPLKQIFFFGDSQPVVLRCKPGKPYDRANQSRQGSALVNVLTFCLYPILKLENTS